MDERQVLRVDGQEFTVTQRPRASGVYDFEWTSGHHQPKYGFTGSRYDGAAMSGEELRAAIASFLSEINPETGYLD